MLVSVNVCERDGPALYNTQLVFDGGTLRADTAQSSWPAPLVAKYRKTHPWHSAFTPGDGKPVAFGSSFGVRSGVFTCKDILYPSPQKQLLAEGVRHTLYSVAVDIAPFVSAGADKLAARWSASANATLLASNLGLTGSGIFQRGVPLAHISRKGPVVAVASVPF